MADERAVAAAGRDAELRLALKAQRLTLVRFEYRGNQVGQLKPPVDFVHTSSNSATYLVPKQDGGTLENTVQTKTSRTLVQILFFLTKMIRRSSTSPRCVRFSRARFHAQDGPVRRLKALSNMQLISFKCNCEVCKII